MNNTVLREARSTPYIGPIVSDSTGRHLHHYSVVNPSVTRQLVNGAISEENFATHIIDVATTTSDTSMIQSTRTDAVFHARAPNIATATTGGVLFNTGGSSSSSTDLSSLVQFYNDSADADITAQWMELYRAQREQYATKEDSTSESATTPLAGGSRKISLSASAAPSTGVDSTLLSTSALTAVSSNKDVGSLHENILHQSSSLRPTKNYSESAENLYSTNSPSSLSYASSTSTIGAHTTAGGSSGTCVKCGSVSGVDSGEKSLLNRSMDVLPRLRDFRILEKCCSVDFSTQRQIPSARLARSKEMPNIADVDDYD